MLRTVGYVFLVLAIGGLAIAWSGRTVSHGPSQTAAFIPEMQYGGQPLPVQKVNDMSFVFQDEK
jgi:hypothetical protein